MKHMKKSALFLAAAMASLVLAQSALLAHDMLTDGTVLTVAPAKLEITSPNKSTKKDETVAFVIDKNTKIKRGDKAVAYADAKIERVSASWSWSTPMPRRRCWRLKFDCRPGSRSGSATAFGRTGNIEKPGRCPRRVVDVPA